MELYDALRHRRSAKSFGQSEPPRDVIERIVEAATWAPNHRLTEPWRFFVLRAEARVRLGERVATAMSEDGATEKAIEALRQKLVRAPVLIVVAQQGTPDNPEVDLEDYGATCAAVQNLLLAAHAEGLSAKWSTGELARMRAVFEHLGLDEADRLVAFIYLGSGDAEGAGLEPKRRPPVVRWVE